MGDVAGEDERAQGELPMKSIYVSVAILACALLALLALRLWDWQADRMQWSRLAAVQPANPEKYGPAMVAQLP